MPLANCDDPGADASVHDATRLGTEGELDPLAGLGLNLSSGAALRLQLAG
jgi:hypothetical protein